MRIVYVLVLVSFMSSCTLNGKITSSANSVLIQNVITISSFDDGQYSRGMTKSSTAVWQSPSGESSGFGYQLAIGTTAGASDVVGWTTVGVVNSYTFTSLNLDFKKTYYTSIRTIDQNGQFGPVKTGDGWDPSWVGIGTSYFPTVNPSAAVRDNQGKIIIGGSFATAATSAEVINRGARLNSDGSRDSSFLYFGEEPTDTALQSDGKVILVGIRKYNGVLVNGIARILSDGSRDESFNTGSGFSGGFNNHTEAVTVQSDGKIIVGGSFTDFNGNSVSRIVRLHADGSIDSSFNVGAGFDNTVKSLAIQSDGKILAVGSFTSYQSISQNYLVRVNTDGSFDNAFALGINITGGDINTVLVQADGMIVVGGNFTTWAGATSQNKILRLTSVGTRDVGFTIGTGFVGLISDIIQQADGKLVVLGNYSSFNGGSQNALIRLNTNGTKDASFNVGTGIAGILPEKLLLQSDGKVLIIGSYVAGGTPTYNGTSITSIFRVNTNASLDNATFITGVGFNRGLSEGHIQSNGQILVFGDSTTYGGYVQPYLMKLNADGTKDTGFNMGSGIPIAPGQNVSALAVQSDDKILIGGWFSSYNGNAANNIARLNSDGSFDSSFNIGTGFGGGGVRDILIQPDGKILVAGSFTTYKGLAQKCLVRLNSDGTKDAAFNVGTGCSVVGDYLIKVALQPNGKVLIGGKFTTFNGSSFGSLNRLNADGSVDGSFNIGGGGISYLGIPSMTYVAGIGVQDDGKIVISGQIHTVSGNLTGQNARLDSSGVYDPSLAVNTAGFSSKSNILFDNSGLIIFGAGFMDRNSILPDGSQDLTKRSWGGISSVVLRISEHEYFVTGDSMFDFGMTKASDINYSGFIRDTD